MERRKFIKQTLLSASGALLLPPWLSSCKKETLFSSSNFSGSVIIVGAGVAGMYAAYLLRKQGVDVRILEASSTYGGRIKSLNGFANFPIELGAEVIRGERSFWYDMVRNSGANFISSELNDLYYFNGSLKTYAQATENTFFNKVLDTVNGFHDYAGDDISVQSYGNIYGIHPSVAHLYNGLVGNEKGSSNSEIGMYGLREIEERWSAGSKNFRVANKNLLSVLENTFSEIIGSIELNTVVTSVSRVGSKVKIGTSDNQTFEADKVILTLPIPVLKSELIQFDPPMAEGWKMALEKIGMDRGIKIIIRFDERFWPKDSQRIYAEGIVPVFDVIGSGERGDDKYLSAFVCGQNADLLASLGEGMIAVILAQLETMFGDVYSKYHSHFIQDWGEEEYVGGAMSYTKPGTGNAREIISAPIANQIYFSGEAMHLGGHFGTVHGAMESALKAVNEILTE